MEELTDADLVERCLKGEPEAWTSIVRRFRRLVYAVPLRMGLKPDEAEEVFQETYATLLEKLGTVRGRERIGLWLAVTARRKALDFIRHRKVLREVGLPDGFDLPGPADLPIHALMRLERQAAVRAAVERLSPRCRALLEGLYYTDPPQSYHDLADRLTLKEGSLGPTRMRCLEKLREALRGGR